MIEHLLCCYMSLILHCYFNGEINKFFYKYFLDFKSNIGPLNKCAKRE